MDLLDRIDPTRYDVDDVVSKLNEYRDFSDTAEELEDEGPLGYAGVEMHPFTALCGEANNSFFVLRDLTGELCFLYETDIRTGFWDQAPLSQGNLSPLELETYVYEDGDLSELAIPLTRDELQLLITLLPDDPPGSLRTF